MCARLGLRRDQRVQIVLDQRFLRDEERRAAFEHVASRLQYRGGAAQRFFHQSTYGAVHFGGRFLAVRPLLGDRGLLEQSKPLIFVRDGAAFGLPRDKQTKRVLRAMDSRYFTILAHPSTRLLGEREACDIDMQAIVRQAKKRGCFLELDAQPDRLDLNDIYCQMARDEGVLVSVDSDARSRYDFSYLDYGIGQARRGWLEPRDVLNTRELPELWRLLRQTMCSSRAAA